MSSKSATLGTLLRSLIDLFDGDVEAAYATAGLAWRPRYTPVLRALMRSGPISIKAIAGEIGVSHSAASQTVSQMAREGLVILKSGADARERIVVPTSATIAMIPALERQQAATNAAACELDEELSKPLSEILAEAIGALRRRSFGARIADAAKAQASTS